MSTRTFLRTWVILFLAIIMISPLHAQMIANITEEVHTNFGLYQPLLVEFTPLVPSITVASDFSNVKNFSHFSDEFSATELAFLQHNHFAVNRSCYRQLFDIYNMCTWSGTPIFVTTDAVLHIYHVLFDYFLVQIELQKFVSALELMTNVLINGTNSIVNGASLPATQEAAQNNLAFLYVAKKLISQSEVSLPESVQEPVNAELALIDKHDGFYFSPIFGNFSKLDYSQFNPRGHYTTNDTLKSFFKAMMWYGWTIFTMEPDKFPGLAERHTLQALMLTQLVYNFDLFGGPPTLEMWDNIYEPTVFFVGRTDDPNIRDYKLIGEYIYGDGFLTLPADSLANSAKLSAFMTEAQKLPEPKIQNWIYGTFTTYKGFRFMGQRFIPDSYMFANLIDPFVSFRFFPKGLDVMEILGSNRAYEILDQVYHETDYSGYARKINEFNIEFKNLNPRDWAQNLYWNWLYCLMPLLYQKGEGYPYFMQTAAWNDKELLTALASWTELRHDTILYAKQSMTPCGIAPGPPKSYVEPNPHLYARLASLVRFTRSGLANRNLLLDNFKKKLDLFELLLIFLKDISIKELENIPLSTEEYEKIFCFGRVMQDLVSVVKAPQNRWNFEADDMAVVADVHTDSNSNSCLEEGVGYPLEIFVIIYEAGEIRLTKGAIFSYYEFTQPIADRLTDEKWRDMLAGTSAPAFPKWFSEFMDIAETQPEFFDGCPDNLYDKSFTAIKSSQQTAAPEKLMLWQNYPNPFNAETVIRFELPKNTYVKIEIYNLGGQKIKTLLSQQMNSGIHTIQWDGRNETGLNQASGIYLCRLLTNNFSEAKKISLLR